jgi:hypothetical protein
MTFFSLAGQILVVEHFYHAARHAGVLPGGVKWADMNWFLKKQGSPGIFVREKPTEGHEFGKCLRSALGESFYPAHDILENGDIRRLVYLARYSELK